MSFEEILRQIDEGGSEISRGQRLLNNPHGYCGNDEQGRVGKDEKRRKARGMTYLSRGQALIRDARTKAGRLIKREKFLKKNYRVVILTECFGNPWKILVKK